jgi:hypothetical protein
MDAAIQPNPQLSLQAQQRGGHGVSQHQLQKDAENSGRKFLSEDLIQEVAMREK